MLDVAVIGAGVAGCSSCYYLTRAAQSLRLGLFEMSREGGGATGQSAAMVLVQTADDVLATLAVEAQKEFQAYEARSNGKMVVLRSGSALYTSVPATASKLSGHAGTLRQLGVQVSESDGRWFKQHTPWFDYPTSCYVSYVREDGYVNPFELIDFYLAGARAAAKEFHVAYDMVETVERREGGGFTITAGSRTWETRRLVIAAGQFSNAVMGMLGHGIGLQCSVRHLATIRTRVVPATFPILECSDDGWYIRPQGAGRLLIGVGPTADDNAPAQCIIEEPRRRDPKVLPIVRRYVAEHMPDETDVLITNYWLGTRAMSTDERPVIGQLGEDEDAVICAGLSAFGITLAPICGRFVSVALGLSELTDDSEKAGLEALSPQRFQKSAGNA